MNGDSPVITAGSPALRLAQAYAPPFGAFDEMLAPPGLVRQHWRATVDHISRLEPTDVARRWDQARRLIHEHGVTYNVYGDPRGMDRPWELDAVPMVVAPDEWQRLVQGLTQRARLIDLILADIYGPQKLLTQGLIPPALLYANPAFLRPCHGVTPPHNRWLHLYAADIGRAADGSMVVIGDRTQAPSGAGYALENRIVVSRSLPEAFQAAQVHRLAPFFQNIRDMLANLAPQHRDNPRIVLLTAGPMNETYFEQAYLARYLGYTLVEGGDLTVRDDRVYLKTLGGLHQVDVILRRVDDDYCDPLELNGESLLGVPGLLQAVRANRVAVANTLGSGVVETAAIIPLLPRLCRALLDEDLTLPSVETRWCGEDASLSYVLDNLRRWVVKSAFPAVGRSPVFAASLSQSQLDDLARRISARPYDYVAQEQAPLSTVPVWIGDHMEPRRMMVRIFLSASGEQYSVMAGGLTRVSSSADVPVVSMQSGGGSKDTWVLSNQPVEHFSLLTPASQPIELSRGGGDLPSRVADHFFWLGRYTERSEGLLRLLRGMTTRLLDPTQRTTGPELIMLRTALSRFGGYAPVAQSTDPSRQDIELELLRTIFDEAKPGGLRHTIIAARRAANIVRDRLSVDAWRVLQRFDQQLAVKTFSMDGRGGIAFLQPLLHSGIQSLAAFTGFTGESMARGQAWMFLDMGRRLERALHTAMLLQCTIIKPDESEPAVLEALLEIADSAMIYRRRYHATLQAAPVLDLLLTDTTDPRAILYQMVALHDHITALPATSLLPAHRPEERIVVELLAALKLADVVTLCEPGPDGARTQLHDLLNRLVLGLPAMSDAISQSYLSVMTTTRQFGSML